jgi:Single-strand binding protein family
MFDNVVRLFGFVGSDAELKTTKTQREYTVLSLATTASWKDKNGDGYNRRTEWHKLVAWGNLSLFAATLKKGARVCGRRTPLPRIRAEETEEAEELRSQDSCRRNSSLENREARPRREA